MKRILALDGGGVRGALTLGYLKKMETILREKNNNPNYLLCDYYDLIGGTSTGCIIAAALVIGKSVDEITDLYYNLSSDIFPPTPAWLKLTKQMFTGAAYSHVPLEKHLLSEFGDIKMFDESLKTGFCAITKRLDTNSVWVLHNNPNAKYRKYNNFFLRDICRATSAAPTYFKPLVLDIGQGMYGTFVDGGLSMSNNPSLQLYLLATVNGYKFNWDQGPENMQITSLGTGVAPVKLDYKKTADMKLAGWATSIPDYLMKDALSWNTLLMQLLSNSPTAEQVDREVGDLHGECIKEAFGYYRYNTTLDLNFLNTLGLSVPMTEKLVAELADMSNAKNVRLLNEIGVKAAESEIKEGMF